MRGACVRASLYASERALRKKTKQETKQKNHDSTYRDDERPDVCVSLGRRQCVCRQNSHVCAAAAEGRGADDATRLTTVQRIGCDVMFEGVEKKSVVSSSRCKQVLIVAI
jgi:hypothetical protein